MAAPVFQLHPDDGPAPQEAPAPEILPPPSSPLAVARVLLEELTSEGQLLLRHWRGEWWQYRGPHWTEAETVGVRKWLYERLEHALYEQKGKDDELESRPWSPDKGKLDRLLDAMTAPALLPKAVHAPSWLDTGESAAGIVPCANGLVDARTQELTPATPRYFGLTAVPVEFDPQVGEPVEWLRFLRTLWPQVTDPDGTTRDADELLALQEWFGYVLSGRMDLQKILLLVGPPRCGKGTIARILTELMGGHDNVASPTLGSLATNFGLQPLIGRPLAIVGDARLQAQGQEVVVERLLSISGEDSLTIDRKNRDQWTGRLPTRFMVLSNELPRFGDASGAIASRFVILTLQESFLGREDVGLELRLRQELAGILKWALDGLQRLHRRPRLTEPAASVEAVQELADMVSPISAFIREVCLTDDHDAAVKFNDLYKQYRAWSRENHRGTASVQRFSVDLRARLPHVKTDYRPKVDGRKLPRHVKGLALNPEWLQREREEGDAWHGADDDGPPF